MTRQLLIDTGDELRRNPPTRRPTVSQLQQRASRRTRRHAGIGAAAVVAIGIGGIATLTNRTHSSSPGSGAVSSASVAPAETTAPLDIGWPPRLLIDGDWEITYFNQNEPGQDGTIGGDLTFTSTAPAVTATTSLPPQTTLPPTVPTIRAGDAGGPQVQVMWSSEDRSDAWSTVPSSDPDQSNGWEPLTVAGQPAQAFKTEALFWVVIVTVPEGGIELRIPANDRAELDALVGAIHPVDLETFDAALPDTVVAPTERADVVTGMLEGVPVPDDFDSTAVVGDQTIYTDRTILATAVASDVACAWLDDWFAVWENQDAIDLETILDALESAPNWPMLQGITPEQSGLPTALTELAGTLRDGGAVQTGAGPAPISRDAVANTLGCDW